MGGSGPETVTGRAGFRAGLERPGEQVMGASEPGRGCPTRTRPPAPLRPIRVPCTMRASSQTRHGPGAAPQGPAQEAEPTGLKGQSFHKELGLPGQHGCATGPAQGARRGDALGGEGRGWVLEASLHRKLSLEVPLAGAARPGPSSGPRRGRPQQTHRGPRLLRRHLDPHLGRPLTPRPNPVWSICPANREATEVLRVAQSELGEGVQCVLSRGTPSTSRKQERGANSSPHLGGGDRQVEDRSPLESPK